MIEISKSGAVATVRYDRGGKANALHLEAITALEAAAQSFAHDAQTQVIVLTGTPSRFCAGVDLTDAGLWAPGADPGQRHDLMARGGAMCERWARLPQVTIAAMEGPVVGGGAVLALALDLRVMAADAFMRFPEVRIGLTLAWGGLPRLAAAVGAATAKRILFTDPRIDAEQAQTLGLADGIAPAGTALEAAQALAAEIALCPPVAMRLTKRAIDAQCDQSRFAHGEVDQFLLAKMIQEHAAAAA